MSIIFRQQKLLCSYYRRILCAKYTSYRNIPDEIITKTKPNTPKAFGYGIAGTLILLYLNYKYNKHVAIPKIEAAADVNLRDTFNFINKVVEKCAPAVVYVEIMDPRRVERGTDDALIISNGSGFIVREDGWILTNAHVVINKPHATIQVKMGDGSVYAATVQDADMNIDLALIKINTDRRLPALNLAKSGDVNIGEWVVALGSPLSLSHSATAGVVSSVSRGANELGLKNFQMKYIQTDAPITFGNSGGPLVNLDGEVIGINNLRITAGISFAIPIDYVKKFLDRINFHNTNDKKDINTQKNLGITTITMTPEMLSELLTKYNNLTENINHGVLIWKVVNKSTADIGGLQAGDIITHVNGAPVYKASDIYAFFSTTQEFVSVDLIRSGEKKQILIQTKKN